MTDGTFFEDQYVDYTNLDSIEEKFNNAEKELGNYSFKNYYNPFKKENLTTYKLFADGVIVASVATAIFFTPYFLFSSALIITVTEIDRFMDKSWIKKKIKNLKSEIKIYDNFKTNIDNSKVEVTPVKEAASIVEGIPKLKNISKYVEINYSKINEDLIEIYQKIK